MHELALAAELVRMIERVARQHHVRRVVSAGMRIGAMTHVEPDALTFAFEVASQGSVAEGCRLVFERVPLTARCEPCGWQGEPLAEQPGCPQCGGPTRVLSGRELDLVTIDANDGDEPKTEG